jgi:hypothetical protein
MNRKELTLHIERQTDMVWDSLCEIDFRLARFNAPKIKLDGRLWRTAGMCHQDDRIVKLGYKFFTHSKLYFQQMCVVILPHEIIHQADFDLFGESEKICGHGKNWCNLMVQYGLKPQKYHTMEISR